MKSKGPRKQSKGSPPSKPKEFRLTQKEISEWKSILEDFDEYQAQAFELQAKEAVHNAWRTRFWARVCKRLGIRTDEVDTTKPVMEAIHLKPPSSADQAGAAATDQNIQHKKGEGNEE